MIGIAMLVALAVGVVVQALLGQQPDENLATTPSAPASAVQKPTAPDGTSGFRGP